MSYHSINTRRARSLTFRARSLTFRARSLTVEARFLTEVGYNPLKSLKLNAGNLETRILETGRRPFCLWITSMLRLRPTRKRRRRASPAFGRLRRPPLGAPPPGPPEGGPSPRPLTRIDLRAAWSGSRPDVLPVQGARLRRRPRSRLVPVLWRRADDRIGPRGPILSALHSGRPGRVRASALADPYAAPGSIRRSGDSHQHQGHRRDPRPLH